MNSFEKSLEKTLQRHLAKETGTPQNLIESIRYSLLTPGKRIRPRLALECGQMTGLNAEAAMACAVAIEMVHCFTLIHDDLPCMDDDDFRRGLPSNHKKFGEALALLSGDALMALGIDAFLDAAPYLNQACFLKGFKRFSWAMGPRGVIGGQAAEALLNETSTLPQVTDMHQRKTGALFSGAILIPKDFSGLEDDSPRGSALIQFAEVLGNAFQTTDDIDDKEKKDPTSILFYKDAKTAASQARNLLKTACQNLETHWGPSAAPLNLIAGEVLTALAR